MTDALFPVLTASALAMITAGSFLAGWLSTRVNSRAKHWTLIAAGVSMPVLVAAALFLFVAPAREITYDLVPFGVAIMMLPISTALTFWGMQAKRGA